MAKNAYPIITDFHSSVAKKVNRFSYEQEIMYSKVKIVETCHKYHSKGYSVKPIFLGDIYDRGYKSITGAILDQNFIISLYMQLGTCYAVLGNHEISFAKNNPYCTLCTEIESEKIRGLSSLTWAPVGIIPAIRLVDTLVDGDVVFHFNHYGTRIETPVAGKVNVGLFHQEIAINEIIQDAETQYKKSIYSEFIVKVQESFFTGYQYCFLGHLHDLYGIYQLDTNSGSCILQCLSTLGRPQVSEVNDLMLERDIPVVIVDDGHFIAIEHNTFDLPDRKSCVKEDVVKKQQINRQQVKALKKSLNYSYKDDVPMNNVVQALGYNTMAIDTLQGIISHQEAQSVLDLRSRVKRLI